MFCFDQLENITFAGTLESQESKLVSLWLGWCGESDNPGPNCVDEDDAYSFRNFTVELTWFREMTEYFPQASG